MLKYLLGKAKWFADKSRKSDYSPGEPMSEHVSGDEPDPLVFQFELAAFRLMRNPAPQDARMSQSA
jgi:hypothetical protein